MSRGGHNWKGSGTVEGSRSLSVMKLARAGFLSGRQLGSWQWTNRGDITATIQIVGERTSVTLHYRVRAGERGMAACPPARADPLDSLPLRRRASLVCLRRSRQWGVLRPAGCKALWCWPALRLPALLPPRICGAARRADGPSSSSLATPASQARSGLRWAGRNPPRRPKWMRQRTYHRVVQQIEAGEEHLDHVFMVGAQRILARVDKLERRGGMRR